ncbi:hypothetical protein BDZ94DRAFT_1249342 [Collybia nuda]|uniref:Uncharacterized protein n=1 Tax=Collybia nuda TaxID=64659 RepID=A0A9P5YEK4_9AGAR|nr:hypothetical protein BDZ94DRAFT_1249342 [Collybia nuda]
MPDISNPTDLLLLAGTPSFFPAILSYVRSCTPGSSPLDHVIFQAILLCLISGNKHLILHTPDEDVGLVARLSVWTLSSIFGLPTHRLKIRPKPSQSLRSPNGGVPQDSFHFLRSLLLRTTHDDTQTLGSKHTNSSHEYTHRARPRSANLKASPYARSASFPNTLSSATTSPSSGPSDPFADQGHSLTNASAHLHSSTATPKSLRAAHAHTEPTPFRQRLTDLEFPHGLVLSGLENASPLDQRALSRVLTEKQIVLNKHATEADGYETNQRNPGGGRAKKTALDSSTIFDDTDSGGVWNAPEDFITIYVCPWNTRERPDIHKTLLDKFAMSTTVLVRQSVRQALRALPFTSHPPSNLHNKSHSYSNPGTPASLTTSLPQIHAPPFLTHPLPGPHHYRRISQATHPINVVKEIVPRDLLRSLRSTCSRVYFAPVLSLYLADLFSAARHHPKLEGRLLTVRATKDAEELARAGRILGLDPTGSELLRQTNNELAPYNDEDDRSSFPEYDEVQADIGSGSALINMSHETVYLDPIDHSDTSVNVHDKGTDLDVSEADIARIVPRVITHRLRVRDSPEDEILGSAIFGATFGSERGPHSGSDNRSTVKDIIVSILVEV